MTPHMDHETTGHCGTHLWDWRIKMFVYSSLCCVTHVTGAFMHVFAVCGVVYVNVCCLGANLIVCEHRHNHIETA